MSNLNPYIISWNQLMKLDINQANLRDLIVATVFVPTDLEIRPCKTKGHLFYNTSRFVHHFKAMCEFKLELQSRNAQLGSISVIFCPVWPWNLMDDLGKQMGKSSIPRQALSIISKPWVNSNWSNNPETLNLGQFFLSRVTLKVDGWPWKNNRALLLSNIKRCASSNWAYGPGNR